jgi:3-hydroxyacyl-[acyl-carrier-protein] dehydratase
MLQNDFFTISSINREGDSFRVLLELNAAHKIFEGHFPGQPIVPGACLMQMVSEVTASVLGRKELRLVKADHLKFIAFIDPNAHRVLEMRLTNTLQEDASIVVKAILSDLRKPCFKFSGTFV